MPPPQQPSRINIAELKAQIVKKVGSETAERYFGHLTKLLSQKLSKVEFDKLCYSTIGQENIALHNQFIQSILRNAYQGKVPPPPAAQDTSKPVKGVRRKPISPSVGNEDGSLQNSSHPSPVAASVPTVWSNGDTFPLSPRKGRSGIRDRKARDRPSPLGPHGKSDFSATQGVVANDEAAGKGTENGDLNSCDLSRPLQHPPGSAEQPHTELNSTILPPLKRQRIKITAPPEQISVDSKAAIEVVNVEDGEEVEQVDDKSTIWVERPLRAPLGVPFCPGSVGAARRAPLNGLLSYLPPASSNQEECFDRFELPDTDTLRRRMDQIAAVEGLQGVSMDCANLLNNGLDSFLKKLIKSSLDLRGATCHKEEKHVSYKQIPCKLGQGVNGVWPGHSMQIQSTGVLMEAAHKMRSRPPITLLDFKVAMELNPQQLGEDWPLQLEKLCLRVSEEE